MKAAVYNGIEDITIEEMDDPTLSENDVLLKPLYCGICGSDLTAWKIGTYESGVVIGHEFSAEVLDVGPNVKNFQRGDIVVSKSIIPCFSCAFCQEGSYVLCNDIKMPGITLNGGCAELTVLPEAALVKIPKQLDSTEAALLEPLSVVLHGFDKINIPVGADVLILGAGPIGLLAMQVAKLSGTRFVCVSEPNPHRREIVEKIGNYLVIDPNKGDISMEMERKLGISSAEIVIDTTGVADVVAEALSLLKKGGTLLSLGIPPDIVEGDFMSLVLNELTIKGSYCSFSEYERAINLLVSKKISVKEIITKTIPLEKTIEQGIKELLQPQTPQAKILVKI